MADDPAARPRRADLLLHRTPFPAGLGQRLHDQLTFLVEIDQLKFEERRSPEARFAKAMDRLQPLLLNWMARGGTWRSPGITADDVRARKALIGDASTELGVAARQLIDEGERRGWSRPGARLRAAPGPPGDGGPARG